MDAAIVCVKTPGTAWAAEIAQRIVGREGVLLTIENGLGNYETLTAAIGEGRVAVGVIYVGPKDDFGYNQAQAQAAAELKKLPGVKVVEEENVSETTAVQKTMTGMIAQDGAKLIFPTSFGYFDPHMLKMAAKFPKVQFRHCGGMWTAGKHPANTGSYFGYIDEGQYLNGVIAGHASKSGKLGFIDALSSTFLFLSLGHLFFTKGQPWPVLVIPSAVFLGVGLAIFSWRQRLAPDDEPQCWPVAGWRHARGRCARPGGFLDAADRLPRPHASSHGRLRPQPVRRIRGPTSSHKGAVPFGAGLLDGQPDEAHLRFGYA